MLSFLARRTSARHIALSMMLTGVVLGNLTPIFSKILFAAGWDPVALYFEVLIIMSIVLGAHEFIALERGERWGMTRGDLKGTLLGALIGGVVEPILFFTGLRYVSASDSVLLTGLVPLFVVILAVLMLKERFTKQMVIGGIFLVFGIVALLWEELLRFEFQPGALLLIASSFMAALSVIVHKKYVLHRHLDSIVLVRTLVSTVCIGVWILFTNPSSFSLLAAPQHFWLLLAVPICGFLLPFFLFFRALRDGGVTAMEAGFVSATGKLAGILLASSLLGEALHVTHAFSMVFTVIGIIAINVPLTKLRIVPSRLPEIGPLRR